jgi:peptide/nickel transport system permease protein
MRRRPYRLWVGAGIVGALVVVGLLGPLVAPYAPEARDAGAILSSPSAEHWLGADEEGRDILTLLIHGARVALLVGLGAVLVSALLGTAVGLISGYARGLVDVLLQRLIEVVFAFPGILLAILIVFVTGRPSVLSVVAALAATGWAGYARLVRGQVLSRREEPYVMATRVLGLPLQNVLLRHVLPSVAGSVVVLMTFQLATAILAETGLSYLGLGPQDGTSWGGLLEQGAVLFVKSPLIGLSAGLSIAVTVIGVNLLGDHLRDWLDPRISE